MDATLADTIWLIVAAALVFLMQGGFLCLEAGLTRTKNSINVAIKNVTDFGLTTVLFWAFGFAIMFGASSNGWFGTTDFFLESNAAPYTLAFFVFQAMFCGTAVTIMSGAVAERVRFGSYLFMSVIVTSIVYPLFGHWAWGGGGESPDGWLKGMGFVDFAGSSVVHSVGGWAALIGVMVLGARTGRFDEKTGKPREINGSNLPLAMLGVMMLWFGWIGFNGGSTLALNNDVPLIVANTMIAASAGLVASLIIGWIALGYPHPSSVINGTLGGLVAITANCHCVSATEAVLIGAIGAAIVHFAERLLLWLQIDDAVAAVPVHLAAGIFGTLAVALFGDPEILGTGLTMTEQLGVQALGVAVCGGLTIAAMAPTLYLADRYIGLRVTHEEERVGLNVAEHHATTELLDFVSVIEHQANTKDLSLRAPVEPFTEVGQIATHYNRLISSLEQSTTDITHLKRVQARLKDAKRAADDANAAKTEFLANMSHEIRTPLHGILSFAGFGLRKVDTAPPEKIADYFNKIQTSGERLLGLVTDLLDLSKLEAGKMRFDFEEQDLTIAVAAVVDEVESLVSERNIRISFIRPKGPIVAVVDQVKIMQVVRNLVSNAIKFSKPGGTITVAIARIENRAEIVVHDCGDGIPEGETEKIFGKFEQSSKTKSGSGGTGLGLAICRELVTAHEGTVVADNHPSGGAVFTVTLPLKPETPTESTTGFTPIDKAGADSVWAERNRIARLAQP